MALQDHIHLSDTLDVGGEKAPNIKWSVVYPYRIPLPVVYMNVRVTQTGKVRLNTIKNGSDPILRMDYKYRLMVKDRDGHTSHELLDILYGFKGKRVYVCDNYHVDDGDDHTDDINTYILKDVSYVETSNPLLTWSTVEVELIHDNSD